MTGRVVREEGVDVCLHVFKVGEQAPKRQKCGGLSHESLGSPCLLGARGLAGDLFRELHR